jgi:hypothetical protein
MDVESIADEVRRTALKTMIKTYGQTPKQLFRTAHPTPPAQKLDTSLKTKVSLVCSVLPLPYKATYIDIYKIYLLLILKFCNFHVFSGCWCAGDVS